MLSEFIEANCRGRYEGQYCTKDNDAATGSSYQFEEHSILIRMVLSGTKYLQNRDGIGTIQYPTRCLGLWLAGGRSGGRVLGEERCRAQGYDQRISLRSPEKMALGSGVFQKNLRNRHNVPSG